MRVKHPELFDVKKEYKPGDRVQYRGFILIAVLYTAFDRKLSIEKPHIFYPRCIRCMIKREDCPGLNLQCYKLSRSDRKTIYWRFVRLAKGYTAERDFVTDYKGNVIFVNLNAIKKENE